jgi:hypothetical protein
MREVRRKAQLAARRSLVVLLARSEAIRTNRRCKDGRFYSYSEVHYFGNPGYYQHFVFTASVAAHQGPIGPIYELAEMYPEGRLMGGLSDPDYEFPEEAKAVLGRIRRETVVTTYTVIGGFLMPENFPAGFGPHGDEVRTLP